jgi:hypothetical protein
MFPAPSMPSPVRFVSLLLLDVCRGQKNASIRPIVKKFPQPVHTNARMPFGGENSYKNHFYRLDDCFRGIFPHHRRVSDCPFTGPCKKMRQQGRGRGDYAAPILSIKRQNLHAKKLCQSNCLMKRLPSSGCFYLVVQSAALRMARRRLLRVRVSAALRVKRPNSSFEK